jgi:hypothetical protein
MLMFQWIVSLLATPAINGMIDAYKAKLAAGNDADRIAADLAGKAMEAEAKQREAERTILLAEQGHWATRWVRPLWAAPFVIYTWKVVFWDICLGWGTTDAIRGDMASLMMIVAGTYFGGRSLEKIATTIWRK